MNKKIDNELDTSQISFSRRIGKKAARKLTAQRDITQTIWSGLGAMGLVGWSVAMPTLLGIALGVWIDKHYQGSHSWTLLLLVLGLSLGCFNAWYWVAKEDEEIHLKRYDDDE